MRGGGKAVYHAVEGDPQLLNMWEEYEACRSLQWVTFRKPDGKNEKIVQAAWPSGFSTTPFDGGWADQPYFYLKIFCAFLAGEREGVIENMNK